MDSYALTPEQVTEAVTAVQAVFRQVGTLIVERAGQTAHTDKQDGSPLTKTDVEVENIILAALAEQFPSMPVYGEESGYGTDLPDTFWLIDPIDGTKSFMQNIPSFTSMAVLIQNGEATASVIYNPSTSDMYTALKGKGANKNGTRLDLSSVPLPAVAYCKERFVTALNGVLAVKHVTCKNGPAGGGYGFTRVADGLAAARFNLLGGGYIHDYAPGALLVREAGGSLLAIQDKVYTYETRSFIACHPEITDILRPEIGRIKQLEIELAG